MIDTKRMEQMKLFLQDLNELLVQYGYDGFAGYIEVGGNTLAVVHCDKPGSDNMARLGDALIDGLRGMDGFRVVAQGSEKYFPKATRTALKTIVVGCIVQRKEMADFNQGRRGHVVLLENNRAYVRWFDGPHGVPLSLCNWVDLDEIAFLGFTTDHA